MRPECLRTTGLCMILLKIFNLNLIMWEKNQTNPDCENFYNSWPGLLKNVKVLKEKKKGGRSFQIKDLETCQPKEIHSS